MKNSHQCLLVGVTSACVALSVLTNQWSGSWTDSSLLAIAAESTFFLLVVTLSIIAFDMYRLGPADSLSYRDLVNQYIHVKKMMHYGAKVHKRDEDAIATDTPVGDARLLEILSGAANTAYAKENGLVGIRSVAEFRQKHPLTTYDRYRPYVDRVIQGEEDILFDGKPLYLGTTSGTTGKYKTYPKSPAYFILARDYLLYKSYFLLYSMFPSIGMKKELNLVTYHPPATDGGYKKGPVTSAFANYQPYFVTPEEGYFLSNAEAARYIRMLFSLAERDLGVANAFFSSVGLVFFQKIESSWEELCDDIELGRIRDGFEIPADKLAVLRSKFNPNPSRAAELRAEFRRGFVGIVARIWPGFKVSVMISTGVFKASADILRETYLKGIPNFSRMHGGTEGGYGLARDLGYDPTYYLLNSVNFMELLPVEGDGEETVLVQEAKVGERYEIVVTTEEGLYRYKTTDVIEVVGFAGQTVMYKFAQRVGDNLYLVNEKTPVHVVESGLYSALRSLAPDDGIADFCCTESVNVDRVKGMSSGCLAYWVFVELTSGRRLPKDFDDQVETYLTTTLDSYRRHRHQGTADKVKVVQLRTGAFEELRLHILATRTTTAVDQYKAPRLTRNDEFICVFLDHAMCDQ